MALKWKTVRVFISSTFRDMHAERDHLVKVVFPELRARLEKYRIHLVDIDLRWGVTKEQADNDQVLDLCLAEIDGCRPHFVGILGERYGWVPGTFPAEALSKYGWVQHHTGKSVTELEILYGVLQSPEMHDRAAFYFRDPKFLADVPPGVHGQLDVESPESAGKLKELKGRIRQAGLPVAEYGCRYAGLRINWRLATAELSEADRHALENVAADGTVDPEKYRGLDPQLRQIVDRYGVVRLDGLEAFGRRVRDQLWEAIRTEEDLPEVAPAEAAGDPLAEEEDYHERFMESRLRVYVGREGVQEYLAKFADGDDEVACVVVGPAGSGKSAALARFVTQYRTGHPETLIIPHFVGASPHSTSLNHMLRRFCLVLAERFGFSRELPEETDKLVTSFRGYLASVPAEGWVVLAIDAVNQLDQTDQARELHWLSEQLPGHVKVIASCIAGPGTEDPELEAFGRREFRRCGIGPLEDEERRRIIREVPSLSAKTLDEEQVRLLLSNPATANPLFLLVALEELRGFGSFEQLNARIGHFPREGDTVTAVFVQVIERLEEDFDAELVRTVLTLLASARRGLSEGELQALVADVPGRDDLFPVLRQLRSYLLSRGELVDFYHRSLFGAVRQRHLASDEAREAAHLRLADYFAGLDLAERMVEELPWQLAEACAWQCLHDLLAVLPFFAVAWDASEQEVRAYWARVETGSPWRMVDAYRPVLDDPAGHRRYVWPAATLLQTTGHPQEAFSLREHLVEHYRRTGDRANLEGALGNQALILRRRGDLDGAMRLHKESERVCRELGNKDGLQTCFGNQALILRARGDLDGAMWLHKEEERICRELGNKDGLGRTLGNQANILQIRGDLDGAMRLLKEEERICRELGNKDGLSSSLGNQALILQARGDLDGAMRLHKEAERICRELGDKDGLQACFGNQAFVLNARGDLDGAMRLHKEQERICRELGNKDGLQRTLGNQALILYARGDLDGAMRLLKEEERICRELGNKDGLSASLGNQAVILKTRGDLDGAMKLHQEQERICREVGNKDGLQACFGNQALILQIRGDLDGGMRLHKESERICRELGNEDGLGRTLGNQALILKSRGDLDGAMKLHQEEERICRELGNKDGLSASLGNQAVILTDRGDLDGAMRLHQDQERICRELGNKDGFSMSLGNQANILHARGDLDGAMRLLKEVERLGRELGNKDSLQRTLGNQAQVLTDRGDLNGAMRLYQDQERICRELGNKNGLAASLRNRALILHARGDLDRAMKLHQEQGLICRELGEKEGLQASLGNQAAILYARGDLDGAMRLHKEQERICRELGNKDGLQRTLGNQAVILQTLGDLDGAMRLHRDEEQICRELGDKDGLQRTFRNQAVILRARGDLDGAFRLHREQERICREMGNVEGIAISLANQVLLLAMDRNRPEEALPLAEEAYRLARDHGYAPLAEQIKPIMDDIRSML